MLFDAPEPLNRITQYEESNVEGVSLKQIQETSGILYICHSHLCKPLPLPSADRLSAPSTFLPAPPGVLGFDFPGFVWLCLGFLGIIDLLGLELFGQMCSSELLFSTKEEFTSRKKVGESGEKRTTTRGYSQIAHLDSDCP